jgi:hypothetical protein
MHPRLRTLMPRRLPSLLACHGLLLVFAGPLPAWQLCGLCTERQSLTQSRDQSDALLLVQFISSEPDYIAKDLIGRSTFEVVHAAWDVNGLPDAGESITVNDHRNANPGDLFLVLGSLQPRVHWGAARQCTIDGFDYLRRAPPARAEPAVRLHYYLQFLEHPDPLIADDAAFEIFRADFRDLAALAPVMRPDLLRKWVVRPELTGDRLAAYGLLLGLCGGPEDADVLKQVIVSPTTEFRLGIDYVVAGYLLLAGAQGLDVLDEAKLRNADALFSETYAVMQALRFLRREAPERIPNERLCASMRILLDRADYADLVIIDLTRWEDWSVTDRLMDLYDKPDFTTPAMKRAIVRYYLHQRHVGLASPDADAAEYVRSAEQHLAEIRRVDPGTVQQAERFHFVH